MQMEVEYLKEQKEQKTECLEEEIVSFFIFPSINPAQAKCWIALRYTGT